MKSLFSITPPNSMRSSDEELEGDTFKKLRLAVLHAHSSARISTRSYEMALASIMQLPNDAPAGVIRCLSARATATKKAMCRDALILAKACSMLLADALGSWVPASDQAGTGLDVEELEMIGYISGRCEPSEFGR